MTSEEINGKELWNELTTDIYFSQEIYCDDDQLGVVLNTCTNYLLFND